MYPIDLPQPGYQQLIDHIPTRLEFDEYGRIANLPKEIQVAISISPETRLGSTTNNGCVTNTGCLA